jgi:hypothetical protein
MRPADRGARPHSKPGGRRPGLQAAAHRGGALTHPGDPDPGLAGSAVVVHARSVLNLKRELVSVEGEGDANRGAGGVAARVRERLLHDPVGRERRGVRDARRLLPGHLQLHFQPVVAGALDELGDVLDPRAWRTWGLSGVWVAEDAEDRSQLTDRAVACVLDPFQRRPGAAWGEALRGRGGLHVDLGERVSDDVVELGGDPHPLLLGEPLGLLLARVLGQLEALGEQ